MARFRFNTAAGVAVQFKLLTDIDLNGYSTPTHDLNMPKYLAKGGDAYQEDFYVVVPSMQFSRTLKCCRMTWNGEFSIPHFREQFGSFLLAL